jgi:hypothetical protein
VGAFFRVGKNLLEVAGDALTMRVENGSMAGQSAKPIDCGDLLALLVGGRQHVRLRVVDVLQAVFEAAQEVVGAASSCSLSAGSRRRATSSEHLERRRDLQRRVAAAADQLEDLGDELDLADAAGAELDVVGHVLARHFAANLRVQVAHGVDGAEVEILAENEGAAMRSSALDHSGCRLSPSFITRALIQA